MTYVDYLNEARMALRGIPAYSTGSSEACALTSIAYSLLALVELQKPNNNNTGPK